MKRYQKIIIIKKGAHMFKRRIAALSIILLAAAAAAWGQNGSGVKSAIFDPDTLIVDVRTPSEYAYEHIENAVNIPFNKIAADMKYFAPDKEKTIVVYCESGSRAHFAERKLKELGYKNVINAGRYKDLKALEEKME